MVTSMRSAKAESFLSTQCRKPCSSGPNSFCSDRTTLFIHVSVQSTHLGGPGISYKILLRRAGWHSWIGHYAASPIDVEERYGAISSEGPASAPRAFTLTAPASCKCWTITRRAYALGVRTCRRASTSIAFISWGGHRKWKIVVCLFAITYLLEPLCATMCYTGTRSSVTKRALPH
jgi:hypothetical protein